MSSARRTATLVCLGTLICAGARAQAPDDLPPFAPGRPGITESGGVVGRGIVQIEMGLDYEEARADASRVRSLSLPSALIRLGISPRLELRLAGGAFSEWVPSRPGSRQTGVGDLTLGGKVILLRESPGGIELAALPGVSLPTGGEGFTSDAVVPSMGVSMAKALPADFGLGGLYTAAADADGDERVLAQAASAALGHDLIGGWAGFVELAVEKPARGADADWLFNSGVSRIVGERVQIDAQIGHGLTDGAPAWTASVGVVLRHPYSSRH